MKAGKVKLGFYQSQKSIEGGGEQDADGWRRGECLAIVPPDVDEAVFELNAIQRLGETAAYDAIRIIRIDGG